MTKPDNLTKYRSKRIVVDGETFDSRAEFKRWSDLQILQRAGQITNLRRQVKYILAPSVKIEGEVRARAPLRYIADAVYVQNGKEIVEDTKGHETREWRIKKHLMKSVHNIDVRVVR